MKPVKLSGHRVLEVGVIEIRGEDTHTWLQGQVTADLRDIDGPVYTLLLTPKGRVVSDGWVLPVDAESLDLVVPAHAADAALERLDRFLVMEDVELELRTTTLFHVVENAEDRAVLPRVGVPGWDSTEPLGDAIDDATWTRARIEHGIPQHGQDFGIDTLPQEAGLKRAISFEKGCYIGQEPVVMLEHRGQPPRRLVRVRVPESAEQAAEIHAEGAVAGRLTSVSGQLGLALIKRKRLKSGLQIDGEPIEVLAILGDEN